MNVHETLFEFHLEGIFVDPNFLLQLLHCPFFLKFVENFLMLEFFQFLLQIFLMERKNANLFLNKLIGVSILVCCFAHKLWIFPFLQTFLQFFNSDSACNLRTAYVKSANTCDSWSDCFSSKSHRLWTLKFRSTIAPWIFEVPRFLLLQNPCHFILVNIEGGSWAITVNLLFFRCQYAFYSITALTFVEFSSKSTCL